MALFARYTFDTGDGTDSGGQGLNASLIASPTFPAGKVNACISVNGSTQYARTAAFQGPQSAMTMMGWVNPTSVSSTQAIMCQYNAGTGQGAYSQIFITATGVIHARIQSSSTDTVYIGRSTAANALAAGSFQHVAMTWNGGSTNASIAIYVNGVQVDTTNDGGGTFTVPNSAAVPLAIGGQQVSSAISSPFGGKIDEVQIFSTALTQAQIQAIMSPSLVLGGWKKYFRPRQFKRRIKLTRFLTKIGYPYLLGTGVWMWSAGMFSGGPFSSAGPSPIWVLKKYFRPRQFKRRLALPNRVRQAHNAFPPAQPLKFPLKTYKRPRQFKRTLISRVWLLAFHKKAFPPAVALPFPLKKYFRPKQYKRRYALQMMRRKWHTVLTTPPPKQSGVWSGNGFSGNAWSTAGVEVTINKLPWINPILRRLAKKKPLFYRPFFRPKHLYAVTVRSYNSALKGYKIVKIKPRKPFRRTFSPRHIFVIPAKLPAFGSALARGYKILRPKPRKLFRQWFRPKHIIVGGLPAWIWSAGPFSGGPYSAAGPYVRPTTPPPQIVITRGSLWSRLIKRRPKLKLLRRILKQVVPPAPPTPVTYFPTWVWGGGPYSGGIFSGAGQVQNPPPPAPPPPPGPPITFGSWMWSSSPLSGTFSAAGQVLNPPPPVPPTPPAGKPTGGLATAVTLGPARVTQATLQQTRAKATSLSQQRSVSSTLQVSRKTKPPLQD